MSAVKPISRGFYGVIECCGVLFTELPVYVARSGRKPVFEISKGRKQLSS